MRQLVRENRPGRESWGGRGVVWKERVGEREGGGWKERVGGRGVDWKERVGGREGGGGVERERRGIERA